MLDSFIPITANALLTALPIFSGEVIFGQKQHLFVKTSNF